LIFIFLSYFASGKLLSLKIWYLIYSSTIEDIAHWLIEFEIPYSWSVSGTSQILDILK